MGGFRGWGSGCEYDASSHQPSEWEQPLIVEAPDVYDRSPGCGDLQFTSRGLKAICS
jgi:hypothetical protein